VELAAVTITPTRRIASLFVQTPEEHTQLGMAATAETPQQLAVMAALE
jgi:hypothetical protein